MNTKPLIAQLGAYDPYTRSVPILASTTNEVDGEAITKWDLTRFVKNPVMLWGHDSSKIPVALARDVEFQPGKGLAMRAVFGSAKANPLSEQLAHCVAEGLVRAVSVGYTNENGRAVLDEVSFVAIGADEDAGTVHIDPEHPINEEVTRDRKKQEDEEDDDEDEDERWRKRVSDAARTLSYHRSRVRQLQLRGMSRTDAIDSFARGLACVRVEERLDANAHVIELHGKGGMTTHYEFGSKKEAHDVGTAMRANGQNVSSFEKGSPSLASGARQASPEESRQAAHAAHTQASQREASLGREPSSKDQADKASKYAQPTASGLKKEIVFHEAAATAAHAAGDRITRNDHTRAAADARVNLSDVQKNARGPRTNAAKEVGVGVALSAKANSASIAAHGEQKSDIHATLAHTNAAIAHNQAGTAAAKRGDLQAAQAHGAAAEAHQAIAARFQAQFDTRKAAAPDQPGNKVSGSEHGIVQPNGTVQNPAAMTAAAATARAQTSAVAPAPAHSASPAAPPPASPASRVQEAANRVTALKGSLAEAKAALSPAPTRVGAAPQAPPVAPKPTFTPEQRQQGHELMLKGNQTKNDALNTSYRDHGKQGDLHAQAAEHFENSARSGGSLGLGVSHAEREAVGAHKSAAEHFREAARDTNDKAQAASFREKAASHDAAAKSIGASGVSAAPASGGGGGGSAGQPRDDHGRWESA